MATQFFNGETKDLDSAKAQHRGTFILHTTLAGLFYGSLYGAYTGGLLGFLYGTAILPGFGSGVGGFIGVVVGSLTGAIMGPLLALLAVTAHDAEGRLFRTSIAVGVMGVVFAFYIAGDQFPWRYEDVSVSSRLWVAEAALYWLGFTSAALWSNRILLSRLYPDEHSGDRDHPWLTHALLPIGTNLLFASALFLFTYLFTPA